MTFFFFFWSPTGFQQVFFGLQLFFRKVPPLFPNSGSAPGILSWSVLCGFFSTALGFVCLPQLASETERNIGFHFILTFEQFAWIFYRFFSASFPHLPVLFGFHNSLNTNSKRNGTSDFILTFVQEQLSASYSTRTSIESESR